MAEKKDNALPTVVFKFNWLCECEGCTKKIKKAVRGAEHFKVDWAAYELTVFDKVDSAKVLGNLKKEFKKKKVEIVPTQPKKEEVDIASPQPEKDDTDGNKKPDDKPEKKADTEKSNDKIDQDKKAKEKKEAEIASPQPEKDTADGNKKPDDKPKKKADKEKSKDKKDEDKKARETEWIEAKKELQEEKELSQLLKPECDEIRQSAMTQVEEMERELVNGFHAYTEIAKRECAKLKRLLEEENKPVRGLILEKDDEVQLAKRRQIEEIDQELARAQKDAELARKDADAAENELTKVKREMKEKEQLIKLLKLETQDTRQVAVIEVEEICQELKEARNEAEHARNDANIAQDCAICLTNEKNMAFGCGHTTCEECGKTLSTCPICRAHITNRIKLFHG